MKTLEEIKQKRAEIKEKALNLGKVKTLRNVIDMRILIEQYDILGWVIEDEQTFYEFKKSL